MTGILNQFINTRFGGKRGFFAHYSSLAAYRIGFMNQYKHVDWARVERIVFVCSGNICRSPYAEARAKLFGVEAASFGLHATSWTAANDNAIRAAHQLGIDLAGHRSRCLSSFPITRSDLLIGMEPAHGNALRPIAIESGAQVTLLGLWREPVRVHIQDPYGRGDEYFSYCFSLIDTAVANIASILSTFRPPLR